MVSEATADLTATAHGILSEWDERFALRRADLEMLLDDLTRQERGLNQEYADAQARARQGDAEAVRRLQEIRAALQVLQEREPLVLQELSELEAEAGSLVSRRLAWKVLRVDEAGRRALIVAERCVAALPYHSSDLGDHDSRDRAVRWEHSTLRAWLNGEFFASLPPHLRRRVAQVRHDGSDIADHVFLLSRRDIEVVRSTKQAWYFWERDPESFGRRDQPACAWWLRSDAVTYSPGRYEASADRERAHLAAERVTSEGMLTRRGSWIETSRDDGYWDVVHREPVGSSLGVRPALWLDLRPADAIADEQAAARARLDAAVAELDTILNRPRAESAVARDDDRVATADRLEAEKRECEAELASVQREVAALLADDDPGQPFSTPLEWRILHVDVESRRVLVITDGCIGKLPYEDTRGGGYPRWEFSNLRSWLNEEFLGGLPASMRARAAEVATLINLDLMDPAKLNDYLRFERSSPSSSAGAGRLGQHSTTVDRVFLLSEEEANTYFRDDTDRISRSEGMPVEWWLRDSPAPRINQHGVVDDRELWSGEAGIRPALWLQDVDATAIGELERRKRQLLSRLESLERGIVSARVATGVSDKSITWRILRVDAEGRRALVVTEAAVARMPYHEPGGLVSWERSTLRSWLNGQFYDTLPEAIRSRAMRVSIQDAPPDSADDVFVLSAGQADAYFANAADRVALFDGRPIGWWLSTTHRHSVRRVGGRRADGDSQAHIVCEDGRGLWAQADRHEVGVRPALWLSLDGLGEASEPTPRERARVHASSPAGAEATTLLERAVRLCGEGRLVADDLADDGAEASTARSRLDTADRLARLAIALEPERPEGYVVALMAAHGCRTEADLGALPVDRLTHSTLFQHAMRSADAQLRARLDGYVDEVRRRLASAPPRTAEAERIEDALGDAPLDARHAAAIKAVAQERRQVAAAIDDVDAQLRALWEHRDALGLLAVRAKRDADERIGELVIERTELASRLVSLGADLRARRAAAATQRESARADAVAWKVVTIDDEGGRALVVAQRTVGQRRFDDPHGPGATDWEGSELRGWLNRDFYEQLPRHVRTRVVPVVNDNAGTASATDAEPTRDVVFLLSRAEALSCSNVDGTRIVDLFDAGWWLRSSERAAAAIVESSPDGGIRVGSRSVRDSAGVRPAMWVSL